jgi:DNA-binding MarR family transcriptional regulator
LRRSLNYLKVKITRKNPTGTRSADSGIRAVVQAPGRYDCIMILDSETKAVELPHEHADELRLWLRLLTCTTLIEGEVRSRLRERFDVTLPRFDLMAQLDKVPEGMTLSDVSKRMMVSNGNVTGLVERLVESGHLDRRTSDSDRRVQVIRLTKVGRAEFRKMAAEHETWIADIFSDLTPKDVRELMRLLAKTKASAQKSARARVL